METQQNLEKATFAGGCFWCMTAAFAPLGGVEKVIAGYTGGTERNPSHKAVMNGKTGHFEAVQIWFNPDVITYGALLAYFFHEIDPSDHGGSFLDRGPQYRSAIFYHSHAQKMLAEAAIERLNRSQICDKPVATRAIKASVFYKAGPSHQDFHVKNRTRYRFYRAGSGRDLFIEKFWQNGNAAVLDHLFSDKQVIQYAQGHEKKHGQVDGIKSRTSLGDWTPFEESGHAHRQSQGHACQSN